MNTDWQGRDPEQLKYAYKSAIIALFGIILLLFFIIVF